MKIYYWANNLSKTNGEGILANLFLKKIIFYNPTYELININSRINYNSSSLLHKYIYPVYGALKIRWYSIIKRKTCFINYLPLWNFIIFILLPKNTILGPITGTIIQRKLSPLEDFFKRISIKIIHLKFNKILFASNFFKKNLNLPNNFYYNFILSDFKFKKNIKPKKFDFVIYHRKYETKGNEFIKRVIIFLANKNYKIAVIGEKILSKKNLKNFGFVNRLKAKIIISESRYAIASAENLYSFFVQDCLSNGLIVFYNDIFKKYCTFFKNQLIHINYKNINKSLRVIFFNLKIYKSIKEQNVNFEIYYKEYFKFNN